MSKLEHVVQKYTIEHYGDLIVPDKPSYQEGTKIWEVPLRSTYPRIMQDEVTNEIVVRFLDLRFLGNIKVNEELQVLEASSSENIEQQLMSRIELWKRQSELIVVKASSDVFAKIAEGIHVLNPLGLILDELTNRKGTFRISIDEVDEQRRPDKIRQYLALLEELEIVKKVSDGYTYGNSYVGLLEETNADPRKLKTVLISHVLKRKYTAIRQVFGISQLEPYVHLANAFYWPSLDAEKLVRTTAERLFERYQDYYYKVSTWDFNSRLAELIDHGAIVKEDGFLTGDKQRFDSMLEMKLTEMQVNP